MNKTILKIIYYTIGSALLSLGITLSIVSKLGAGAFDAQNANLGDLLGVKTGTAMYISIIVLYLITMVLKPKGIYIVGLLLTGLVSFGVNTWLSVIPEEINYAFNLRVLFFITALICLPLGISFIIKSTMPLSPMDNLLMILVDKTKWNIGLIKGLIETSFALIALIFGLLADVGVGALSYGTLIITFGIGPGIAFFMRFVKDIEPVEQEEVMKHTIK